MKGIFAIILFLTSFITLNAQTFNTSADVVNRYVWRGMIINSAPNIQPSIGFNYNGFDASLWGSYSFDRTEAFSEEIDLILGYSFGLPGSGSFGITLVDYYFPNAGFKFGDFDDNGDGGHTIEGIASYTGPENFPVSFLAGVNFYNDKGNNIYFEAGYNLRVKDTDIKLFAGATTGSDKNPAYYGTEDFSVINLGFGLTRKLKITQEFSLPLFANWILNPRSEQSYIVFGFTI